MGLKSPAGSSVLGNAKQPANKKLFDAQAFEDSIKAARDMTKPSDVEEDAHMHKIELWTTLLGAFGLLLAIRGVISPLAMIMLGYYKYAKFAILAHHSLHGGWGNNRRSSFANGLYRRVIDWLDWIFPAAWIQEHNKVHHYKLNEDDDPDFVERNSETLFSAPVPLFMKYLGVAGIAATWKWSYYASNTLKLLHADKPNVPKEAELKGPIALFELVTRLGSSWYRSLAFDLVFRVVGPVFFVLFMLVPFIAGLLSGSFWGEIPFCWYAFYNMAGAELVTNVHAFLTIVTNHSGKDLWHFTGGCKPDTAEFFLRAILGSADYPAGNDFIDYFHGYLNYQAEHHSFPALSPLHYQRLHPHFKKVCAEHGVPFVQENILVRTKKTVQVMVGLDKHKRLVGQAAEQPALWTSSKKCD